MTKYKKYSIRNRRGKLTKKNRKWKLTKKNRKCKNKRKYKGGNINNMKLEANI